MVTVKADDRSRVKLPHTKPGQVFAYEISGEVVKLTPVKPIDERKIPPSKVRFVKHGRYLVGESEKSVDMKAVKDLLADFP